MIRAEVLVLQGATASVRALLDLAQANGIHLVVVDQLEVAGTMSALDRIVRKLHDRPRLRDFTDQPGDPDAWKRMPRRSAPRANRAYLATNYAPPRRRARCALPARFAFYQGASW